MVRVARARQWPRAGRGNRGWQDLFAQELLDTWELRYGLGTPPPARATSSVARLHPIEHRIREYVLAGGRPGPLSLLQAGDVVSAGLVPQDGDRETRRRRGRIGQAVRNGWIVRDASGDFWVAPSLMREMRPLEAPSTVTVEVKV